MNAAVVWLLGSGGTIIATVATIYGVLHSRKHDKVLTEQGLTTVASLLMERLEAALTRADADLRQARVDLDGLRVELSSSQVYIRVLRADIADAGMIPRPYPPGVASS